MLTAARMTFKNVAEPLHLPCVCVHREHFYMSGKLTHIMYVERVIVSCVRRHLSDALLYVYIIHTQIAYAYTKLL